MTCPACEVVAERAPVPGGVVWRGQGFVLHAVAQPTPVRGWLVLTSERHARAWYELTADEAAALGPLARAVMQAQRSALGAEHAYAFAIGDVLPHFHLHLVPRFADTPARLRGRAVFDAPPEDARPDDELAAAARAVAAALR